MARVVDSDGVSFDGVTFRGSGNEAIVVEGRNGNIGVTDADFSPLEGGRQSSNIKKYVSGWRPSPKRVAFPKLYAHLLSSTAVWLFRF